MTFSSEWDLRYSEHTHLSVWPWSDVVSYFHRHAKPFSQNTKVLEIGFGAGANIPFFKTLNINYSGIEGSKAIYTQVIKKYPELINNLFLGDFLCYEFPEKYDVIIDRASMTHNSTTAINNGLRHLASNLNKGGRYIGIDWFSTEHSDFSMGETIDQFTKTDVPTGQFTGVGKIHFSSKEHIEDIFEKSGFTLTKLEHKKIDTEIPNVKHKFASWNLVAELK